MTRRSRACHLLLVAVLVLAVPAGVVGPTLAQETENEPPTPVLDVPETIENGELYRLDGSASSDPEGDNLTYYWNYSQTAPTEYQSSTNRSAVWKDYNGSQDRITVGLGVGDGVNDVQWTNETINVTAAEDPNASFDSSADFVVDREEWTWFNSTSTDNRGIASCDWTFEFGPTVERESGDGLGWGGGSTECAKNYSFPVPGTYDVTLEVTDSAGNTDETTREVVVETKYGDEAHPNPNASLRAPDEIEWGSTYFMNASNSTSEDDIDYLIRESSPDHWFYDEENLGTDTYYGTLYDGQFNDTIDVAVGVQTDELQTDWDWETIEILPVEKPNAVMTGPDDAVVGDRVEFDASESTDNDRIRVYNWTYSDASTGETVHTEEGVRSDHQFGDPGTYNVTLRVGDYVNIDRNASTHFGVASTEITVTGDDEGDSGAPAESPTPTETDTPTDTETGTETPTETETDAPTDPDPPADPDPPQDSGDDDESTTTTDGDGSAANESGPTVDVQRSNATTRVVDVGDAAAGENVTIDLGENGSEGVVGYDALTVRPAGNGSFTLSVTADGNVTANAGVEEFDALSRLDVNATETDSVGDATVAFRVAKDALDDVDADAGDVALRRSTGDDGEEAVDTARVNETDDAYVYRAQTTAVGNYTVGVERPAVAVEDLWVADGEHAAGDTVEVTAMVANTGRVNGTATVALAVDGEDRVEESVEMATGDAGAVTFSLPVESAGEHALRAGNASATLSAAAQAEGTATDGTGDAGGDGTASATEARGPGFGVLVALVAFAGATLLARRR